MQHAVTSYHVAIDIIIICRLSTVGYAVEESVESWITHHGQSDSSPPPPQQQQQQGGGKGGGGGGAGAQKPKPEESLEEQEL